MKTNPNSPAFSISEPQRGNEVDHPGLTKREYFAALAQQGLLANNPNIAVPQGNPINANTEAEARAAMLIHLIESQLITVEEINERI